MKCNYFCYLLDLTEVVASIVLQRFPVVHLQQEK